MASNIAKRSSAVRTKRVPRVLASQDFRKALNQEDLLAEIGERLQVEMTDAGISEDQLAKLLGKEPGYVVGLIHGFANVTVRELADVFSSFNKIVSLHLIHEDVKKRPKRHVVRKTLLSERQSQFSKVSMKFERPGEQFDVEFEFQLKEPAYYPVSRDEMVLLPVKDRLSRHISYIQDPVEEVI